MALLLPNLVRPRTLNSLTRTYSQYDKKRFVEPIYEKKKLDKLEESGKIHSLSYLTVKAARETELYSNFHDIVLEKFQNYIMQGGKKKLAREQLGKALQRIKQVQVEQYNKAGNEAEKSQIVLDPVRVLKQAIENCRPIMKLTSIRRGGSLYQIPCSITDTESVFKAMRWIVHASRDKEGPTNFYVQLANELLDAYNNRGRVVKQKIELHKTCEANRAYAHYRW